jgi:acylphosphatase
MPSRLILSGRVQGVFCRGYCSKYGKLLGISGAVSNLPDGTVQVLLDTIETVALENYIIMLKTNPRNITFYGRIDFIATEKYYGSITGDYFF